MEKMPERIQTTRAMLMDPVHDSTPPGEMKMPEPMMEPTMTVQPDTSPSLGLSLTSASSLPPPPPSPWPRPFCDTAVYPLDSFDITAPITSDRQPAHNRSSSKVNDIANEIAIFLLGRFQSSFAGLSCPSNPPSFLVARSPAPGERVKSSFAACKPGGPTGFDLVMVQKGSSPKTMNLEPNRQ